MKYKIVKNLIKHVINNDLNKYFIYFIFQKSRNIIPKNFPKNRRTHVYKVLCKNNYLKIILQFYIY